MKDGWMDWLTHLHFQPESLHLHFLCCLTPQWSLSLPTFTSLDNNQKLLHHDHCCFGSSSGNAEFVSLENPRAAEAVTPPGPHHFSPTPHLRVYNTVVQLLVCVAGSLPCPMISSPGQGFTWEVSASLHHPAWGLSKGTQQMAVVNNSGHEWLSE